MQICRPYRLHSQEGQNRVAPGRQTRLDPENRRRRDRHHHLDLCRRGNSLPS